MAIGLEHGLGAGARAFRAILRRVLRRNQATTGSRGLRRPPISTVRFGTGDGASRARPGGDRTSPWTGP